MNLVVCTEINNHAKIAFRALGIAGLLRKSKEDLDRMKNFFRVALEIEKNLGNLYLRGRYVSWTYYKISEELESSVNFSP